jgi:hypothetical protein
LAKKFRENSHAHDDRNRSGKFAAGFQRHRGGCAPLSPGKPAGVKQADIEAGGVLLWVGVAALAAGIAVIASQTQGGNSSAATTQ